MAYEVIIRKKGEPSETKWVYYSETDLIYLLKGIRNGFATFEGLILSEGLAGISRLQIIERNWDGLDKDGKCASFLPFSLENGDSSRNRAGIWYAYDFNTGMPFGDPMEIDVSEEYIQKYIINGENEYIPDFCNYDISAGILYIDGVRIKFKKGSDSDCILEHLASNRKGIKFSFLDISENKTGNDTLGSEKSFYNARNYLNVRISKKVPLKEFVGLAGKELYSRYLGKGPTLNQKTSD